MLTSVEVVPPPGASFEGLVMPVLNSTPEDPMVIRNIEGLGPVDAEVTSQSYGQVDGEYYVSSKVGKRNIVLTLGLNNPELGRELSYAYFLPKAGVTLKFNVDGFPGAPVYIDGYVESNRPVHFTQDPELQVSIICPKPYFRKAEVTVTGTAGDTPDWTHIVYNGDQITGFDVTFDIAVTRVGKLYLAWKTTELDLNIRRFKLTENLSLPAGKQFHWSSVQGSKRAEVLPADEADPYNSLLYAMDVIDTFWLTLWPGDNYFRISTVTDDVPYEWSLRYSELFGGI